MKNVEAQIIGGLKVIAKKINTDKPIISPTKSKKANLENYKTEKKIVVEAFNKREKESVNNTKKVEAPKKVEKKAATKVEKVAAPKVEKVAAPKIEKVAAPKVEKVAAPKIEKVAAPKLEKKAMDSATFNFALQRPKVTNAVAHSHLMKTASLNPPKAEEPKKQKMISPATKQPLVHKTKMEKMIKPEIVQPRKVEKFITPKIKGGNLKKDDKNKEEIIEKEIKVKNLRVNEEKVGIVFEGFKTHFANLPEGM